VACFIACPRCSEEPTSGAALCTTCVHNRELIKRLQSLVKQEHDEKVAKADETISYCSKEDVLPGDPKERYEAQLGRFFGVDLVAVPNAAGILGVCLGLAHFLLRKNAAYGDSALKPLRVFSSADDLEGIYLRMDDKLSRLARGSAAGEDTLVDFAGYAVLALIARDRVKS